MKCNRYPIWKILLTVGAAWALVSFIGWIVIAGWPLGSGGEWMPSGGCLEWWGGADDRAAIEIGAHLKLPPGTENLFAHSVRSWQDCTVFASFDMGSPGVDAFLTSTYIPGVTSITGAELGIFTSLLQKDVDWTFEPDKNYLYGSGSSEGGLTAQWIVMEPTSIQTYTIYVVTFLL